MDEDFEEEEDVDEEEDVEEEEDGGASLNFWNGFDEEDEEEKQVEETETAGSFFFSGAAAFSSSSSFPALLSFQELQILHKPVRSELTNVHFEHLQDIKVLEVGWGRVGGACS